MRHLNSNSRRAWIDSEFLAAAAMVVVVSLLLIALPLILQATLTPADFGLTK